MSKAVLGLVVLWSLFGAAAVGAQAAPEAVLFEADEAFNRQTAEQGLTGWLAWFAPNATVFPGRGPMVRGIKGVTAYYEGLEGFPPEGFGWQPDRGGMAASGDLGWTVGEWRIEGAEGVGGRYLSIWRLQEDGSWKVVADCGGDPAIRDSAGLGEQEIPSPEARAVDWVTYSSSAGDLVVRGGIWQRAAEAGEAATGAALTVYARREDGGWEVVTETGFAHPPEAPAEP